MIPSIFYVARPSTSSKGKALVAQGVFVSNLDFVPRNLLSAVLSMVEEMNARKLPPDLQHHSNRKSSFHTSVRFPPGLEPEATRTDEQSNSGFPPVSRD
jgi:hypothetical protein